MQGEIEKTKLELEARYGNRNKSEAPGEPQDDRPLRIDALEKDRKYDLEQGRLQLETERLKHQKEMDRIKLIQESTKNATKNR
jgi:hypothetical protein